MSSPNPTFAQAAIKDQSLLTLNSLKGTNYSTSGTPTMASTVEEKAPMPGEPGTQVANKLKDPQSKGVKVGHVILIVLACLVAFGFALKYKWIKL